MVAAMLPSAAPRRVPAAPRVDRRTVVETAARAPATARTQSMPSGGVLSGGVSLISSIDGTESTAPTPREVGHATGYGAGQTTVPSAPTTGSLNESSTQPDASSGLTSTPPYRVT